MCLLNTQDSINPSRTSVFYRKHAKLNWVEIESRLRVNIDLERLRNRLVGPHRAFETILTQIVGKPVYLC